MSRVGKTYFGKTPVSLELRSEWDGQDATRSWSDGGEVGAVLGEAQSKIEAIVARHAVEATREFAEAGEAAIRAEGSDVVIGLRMWSDAASLIVTLPLGQIIRRALAEMRPRLGTDPEAQAALSNLMALGRQLASIGVGGVPSGSPSGSQSVRPPALPPEAVQAAQKTAATRAAR